MIRLDQVKLGYRLIEDTNNECNEFYEEIAKDIQQTLIMFVCERGHGKSTSLKTIVQYCKDNHVELFFKIFDVSQSWYHKAPVRYRQRVTMEDLYNLYLGNRKAKLSNICDCVYEIGALNKEGRRLFVSHIIKQDWEERYNLKLDNHGLLDKLPFIVYVFEEANVYFGSYSLRKNDEVSPILNDFISVGRNYKLSAFLVTTVEMGEMSPSLRDRSRKIYGRIISDRDFNAVKRKDKELAESLKTLPKYHFVYMGDNTIGPIRIPDTVNHTPIDPFSLLEEETQLIVESKPSPWVTLFVWGVVGLLVLVAILSSL